MRKSSVQTTTIKLAPFKKRLVSAFMGEGGAIGSRRVNKDGLNFQQERFCELYVSGGRFFRNATRSYIEAYGIKIGHDRKNGEVTYESCRSSSSTLMSKPNILRRIEQILDDQGLTEEFVNRQLAFLIMQNANLPVKLAAIKEYDRSRGRIPGTKEYARRHPESKMMVGILKSVFCPDDTPKVRMA